MESGNPQSLQQKKVQSQEDIANKMKEAEAQRDVTYKLKKKGRSTLNSLIYYSLPLLSLAIFAGIIIFGTIPAVKGILSKIDEIELKNIEKTDLETQLTSLEELKGLEATFNQDLDLIEKIVPSEKTQVAKFVGEIDDLALENNLAEGKYESGEQRTDLEQVVEEQEQQAEASETPSVITIPAASSYTAEFTNISTFLESLYYKNDLIIIGLLEMQGYEGRLFESELARETGVNSTLDNTIPSNAWNIDVTFQKYQFSRTFNTYVEENLVPLDERPNEETLKYIRQRFGS